MKTIKIIVSGRVQGVSYRMYTRQKARQLGVKGYVRNLRNGDVEILVAGEDEAINELIKWSKSGSPSAVVSNVRIEKITDIENFQDFEILY